MHNIYEGLACWLHCVSLTGNNSTLGSDYTIPIKEFLENSIGNISSIISLIITIKMQTLLDNLATEYFLHLHSL